MIDPLRHHPGRRRLSGFDYFKRLGPGLVTGASDEGSETRPVLDQVRWDSLWSRGPVHTSNAINGDVHIAYQVVGEGRST